MPRFKLEGMSQDPLPPPPKVRTGQTLTKLTKEEYLKRWRQRFYDPAFLSKNADLDAIAEIAWTPTRTSANRLAPAKPDPVSWTRNMNCRSNGWKRGRQSSMPRRVKNRPILPRVCC